MITPITVTTQAELDAALTAKAELIHINSPAGVWLKLTNSGSSRVEAWGSSSVVALIPILGSTAKCKVPQAVTPCVEVDVHGKKVKQVAK